MEFRTERLILRPPAEDDGPAASFIFGKSRSATGSSASSEPTATSRLRRDIDHWRKHGFGRWTLDQNGKIVGFGGLTYQPGFTGLNLSYHLHPEVWGQGLASEFAVSAVVIGFRDLAAKKIIGLVRPSNLASRQVLEKAGLRLECDFPYGGAPGLLYVRFRL
ncbi:GNAT family N-acetyltransferase [Dongia soli]|uniref:GNAT family N-acetyltransferase n=1 Tax=Dongia soli TaxID=600628 RepID=A0ABU5EBN6_9PROT|nr:GNAT family N-acetyltransferase [Dongia soli]MDY0882980.1 GNAT family N-acetyltransferase [Dongia soli]